MRNGQLHQDCGRITMITKKVSIIEQETTVETKSVSSNDGITVRYNQLTLLTYLLTRRSVRARECAK